MDDLSAMISQIMNDPQSMQQLQSVASSLGLSGGQTTPPAPTPTAVPPPVQDTPGVDFSALASLLSNALQQPAPAPEPAPPPANTQTPDISALSSMLGNLLNQQQTTTQTAAQPQAGSNFDLSALSSLMGGLMGQGQQNSEQPAAQNSNNANISALTSLLGGVPNEGQKSASSMPFDMGTLMKLQSAMSSLSNNRANIDLLMALKPRLKEERAKKVDDAVRVMQLIQFLPLIKETGLFGEMENLLGSFGGSGSGLGGIVGGLGNSLQNITSGLGNGLGGILGNLLGGGRR